MSYEVCTLKEISTTFQKQPAKQIRRECSMTAFAFRDSHILGMRRCPKLESRRTSGADGTALDMIRRIALPPSGQPPHPRPPPKNPAPRRLVRKAGGCESFSTKAKHCRVIMQGAASDSCTAPSRQQGRCNEEETDPPPLLRSIRSTS